MQRLERQAPFLRSVLREANANRRKQLLHLANADQINSVSELVLNLLKGNAPRSRHTIPRLRPHAAAMRQMAKRGSSVKKRRETMINQTGAGLWKELDLCHRRCCTLKAKP